MASNTEQGTTMESFDVINGGTDEVETFSDYSEAVALLNEWAAEYEVSDWYTVEYGWASQDNLAAVRVRCGDGRSLYLSIVRNDED